MLVDNMHVVLLKVKTRARPRVSNRTAATAGATYAFRPFNRERQSGCLSLGA